MAGDHECVCVCVFNHVQLFATPRNAHQAPLSMGFPRQEYWSGFPFPSPGDLPDLGIEPTSPALAGGFFTPEPPGKPLTPTGLYPICRQDLCLHFVAGCLISLSPSPCGGSTGTDARFLSIPRMPRTQRVGLLVLSTPPTMCSSCLKAASNCSRSFK